MEKLILLISLSLTFITLSIIGTLIIFCLLYEDKKRQRPRKATRKTNDIICVSIAKEDLFGILTPNGFFFRCAQGEHLTLAKALCKKLYNEDKTAFYAEDYLLTKGFVFITNNGAYMSHLDGHGNVRCLTQMQITWIKQNIDKAKREISCDLTEILLDNERRNVIGAKPFDNETIYYSK